jgi:hypothetical protein
VRTFIVRLHEDAGSEAAGAVMTRLRGVVDDVASGLRATFRSNAELLTALMAAVAAGQPGPPWGADVAPDRHSGEE